MQLRSSSHKYDTATKVGPSVALRGLGGQGERERGRKGEVEVVEGLAARKEIVRTGKSCRMRKCATETTRKSEEMSVICMLVYGVCFCPWMTCPRSKSLKLRTQFSMAG